MERNIIEAAMELLKDKQSFLVGDVRPGLNSTGDLEVTGRSLIAIKTPTNGKKQQA